MRTGEKASTPRSDTSRVLACVCPAASVAHSARVVEDDAHLASQAQRGVFEQQRLPAVAIACGRSAVGGACSGTQQRTG